MEINKICLYRMTHIENIPHILQYGITHKQSLNSDPHFKSIGDTSLIDFRSTKKISINGKSIILGNCIPFYFGIRMPMLYVIQHGYNFTQSTKAENIIYLAISLKMIIDNLDLTYYFSDGHATDGLTSFYDNKDIEDLPKLIDWKAVTERNWSGDGIETDLKRRKQAEFLVENDIPPKYIVGFVCYNETAKNKLIGYSVNDSSIKIIPNAYY